MTLQCFTEKKPNVANINQKQLTQAPLDIHTTRENLQLTYQMQRGDGEVFNMNKIGVQIANWRKEKKLTQMNMADQLGVSYQAVSNWERGATMPDIAKLPELANILEVSIDELLSHEKGSTLIQQIVSGEEKDYEVTTEEFSNVAPLLDTEKADVVFKHLPDTLTMKDLAAFAPFISQEVLDGCAKKKFDEEGIKPLAHLAPFLSSELLEKCAEITVNEHGIKFIAPVAPFISKDKLGYYAESAYDGQGFKQISGVAPFLNQEVLTSLAQQGFEREGIRSIVPLCPFLDKDVLSNLALKATSEKGLKEIMPILPFIDQSLLNGYVKERAEV